MLSRLNRTSRQEAVPFHTANRRTVPRYAVRFPLQYRATGRILPAPWKRGQTVDMSAAGVLIETSEAMRIGSTLEIVVDWPGAYYSLPAARLFLTARVARISGKLTGLRVLSHEVRYVSAKAAQPGRPEPKRAVA